MTPLNFVGVISFILLSYSNLLRTVCFHRYRQKGLIGEGIHERFIIDVEKFVAKAEGKTAAAVG
ncbi:MAG: hypothetical protein MJZ17_05905 [Bacteroidales bacterium]|nr:hypothetical protein [Bacteroidales bacterium]